MKIYRDIAFRLLAAVALPVSVASCAESNVAPSEKEFTEGTAVIKYQTSLSTRASKLYNSSSDIETFRVWSITEKGAHYIPGDAIIKDSASDKYVQEDGLDRYWPSNGERLGFFAISGVDKEEEIGWTDGDNACVTLGKYRMVKDQEEKKDPWEEKDMHKNPDREFDIIYANTGILDSPDKNDGSAAVNLNFHHALSCIEFRARNIDPALDVEITGIGLKHIQNIGELQAYIVGDKAGTIKWNLPDLNASATPQDGEPEGTAGDRLKPTFKIEFDKEVELHGATEDKAQTISLPLEETRKTNPEKFALMIIPQQLYKFNPHIGDKDFRPHGASLMLRANIWNVADDDGEHKDNDKLIWGESDTKGEWMLLPCGNLWEPGKKYVYTIIFGGEGSYGGYEESETKLDKDRVFDPIGFTVEIEPWIEGGSIQQTIK